MTLTAAFLNVPGSNTLLN